MAGARELCPRPLGKEATLSEDADYTKRRLPHYHCFHRLTFSARAQEQGHFFTVRFVVRDFIRNEK